MSVPSIEYRRYQASSSARDIHSYHPDIDWRDRHPRTFQEMEQQVAVENGYRKGFKLMRDLKGTLQEILHAKYHGNHTERDVDELLDRLTDVLITSDSEGEENRDHEASGRQSPATDKKVTFADGQAGQDYGNRDKKTMAKDAVTYFAPKRPITVQMPRSRSLSPHMTSTPMKAVRITRARSKSPVVRVLTPQARRILENLRAKQAAKPEKKKKAAETPPKETKATSVQTNLKGVVNVVKKALPMKPAWMSDSIYTKSIRDFTPDSFCNIVCPGCKKSFRAERTIRGHNYSFEYYVHCIEKCKKYKELNLVRRCDKCPLLFINPSSFGSHQKAHRRPR